MLISEFLAYSKQLALCKIDFAVFDTIPVLFNAYLGLHLKKVGNRFLVKSRLGQNYFLLKFFVI